MESGNGQARAVAQYLAEIGALPAPPAAPAQGALCQALVRAGVIAGEDLVASLSRRAEGETMDVDGVLLQPDVLLSVPEALAFAHRLLPVHRTTDILYVAVPAGDVSEDGIDQVELLLGVRVEAVPVAEIDVAGVLVKAHQLLRRRTRGATSSGTPIPSPSPEKGPALADLGMPPEILKRLRQALGESQGMILFAGPPEAGAGTTLRAAAAELEARGLRVARLDRSDGLAAFEERLQADPDVLVLDGLDSPSVAAGAVRAAVQGHRVLVALEAPDAAAAAGRLAGMNVDPHLLSTALRAGISQRLLGRTCSECAEARPENPAMLEDLRLENLLAGVPLRKGKGCSACGGTGIRGRVAVFEFGDRSGGRSLRGGYQPLVADALGKMLAGLTTLDQVIAQVPYTQVLQAADLLKIRRVNP